MARRRLWQGVSARIVVEIVGDAGDGQTSADTRTRRENVQVTCGNIPVGIDVLWINRDAVGILARDCLPSGQGYALAANDPTKPLVPVA